MKIDRALILRSTENETSLKYSEICAKTCETHNLPYEFIEGIYGLDCENAFKKVGAFKKPKYKNKDGHCCCHAAHIQCWQRIIEIDKPCIILEHDAYVLGDVRNIDIPNMAIVTFGHRVKNPNDYKPIKPAESLIKVERTMGVHACAMTPKTASWLVHDAKNNGIEIGNDAWLMGGKSGLPLYVCEPPQVVCWVRNCTTNIKRGQGDLRNVPESLSNSWKKGLQK
jgi:hypothetical protein